VYKSIKLLNSEKDLHLKLTPLNSFEYAKEKGQVAITLDEFFRASKSQPIIFTKSKENEYFASVLLGVEKESNSFITDDGGWQKGEYIPTYIRRYPFIFVNDNSKLAVAYDSNCKNLNTKEGNALFDKDANETPYLIEIIKFMDSFQHNSLMTSKFIKELDELNLLEDVKASLKIDGKTFGFTGFKRVDEKKLEELEDETVVKLVKSGSYKFIMAHLISLGNFEKLISLHR